MDLFPELINTNDDNIREIQADDNEGILESSHFILVQKGNRYILSLEHNQYGPRVSDFHFITNHYLTNSDLIKSYNINPLANDIKIDYQKRIGHVSYFIAKIHKDNVSRIDKIDSGIASAFKTISEIAESEYVTFKINVGKSQMETSSRIKRIVLKIVNYFQESPDSNANFEILRLRAKDTENEMKMKDFDLLNIWIKSTLRVDKKPKSRVIFTTDIIQKMIKDFDNQLKSL